MRAEDVSNRLRQMPFAPFRIRLSNNATYDITHPDQILVGRTWIMIGIPAPDLPPNIVDGAIQASLLHVAEFLPLPPLSPAQNNGSPAA